MKWSGEIPGNLQKEGARQADSESVDNDQTS